MSPRTNCSRPFTTSCAFGLLLTSTANAAAIRFKLRIWSTRHTSSSSIKKNIQWQNRAHFFAIAAQAMRRILVDYARGRQTVKRGGGQPKASLDEAILISDERVDELVALDEALTRLAVFDELQRKSLSYAILAGLPSRRPPKFWGLHLQRSSGSGIWPERGYITNSVDTRQILM